MASDRWTINDGAPGLGDKYEWRLPNNDAEQMEQTVAPGELLVRPEDVDLAPTKSPERSGLQHGRDEWNYENAPDHSWNVIGDITDGFDYMFDFEFD
jgi:hypothetical protein